MTRWFRRPVLHYATGDSDQSGQSTGVPAQVLGKMQVNDNWRPDLRKFMVSHACRLRLASSMKAIGFLHNVPSQMILAFMSTHSMQLSRLSPSMGWFVATLAAARSS
jgi:hypothetical protein